MKKIINTTLKSIAFFLGWAVFCAVLPLSTSNEPAIWRLWAEITPLLSIILFTFIFWFIEKKTVRLGFFCNPGKGILIGTVFGIIWLGTAVAVMMLIGVIRFDSMNSVPLLPIWIIAVFLNVVMQELLVRGYLYQMLKQKHNTMIATIATTVLFTALHGGAFEAGFISVMNVLSMSLLMAAVLEYTGSIIAPTIMHFVWNGVGAIILGGVSLADDYPYVMNMTLSGNDLLSGGACKMEGSVVVLVINILLTAFFCAMRHRKPYE